MNGVKGAIAKLVNEDPNRATPRFLLATEKFSLAELPLASGYPGRCWYRNDAQGMKSAMASKDIFLFLLQTFLQN